MSPEAQYFLDRAETSLVAARRDLEADDRLSAVSHAYYVAFYAATAALLEQGYTPRSHGGTHRLFHEHFARPNLIDPEHARALSALYQQRQDADYSLNMSFEADEANDAIDRAARLFQAVRDHLAT